MVDSGVLYDQLVESAQLSALRSYGVDNWSFYGEACDRAREEGIDIDSDEFLSVLKECGVDNWDGYSEAGAANRSYLNYLDDLYEHDEIDKALSREEFERRPRKNVRKSDPETPVEKPKHVPDEYDKRVLQVLAEKVDVVDENEFLAFMKTLKSRTWHPLDFDYAKAHVSDGVWQASEFKRQALSIYMGRLSDDDLINDWNAFTSMNAA
jgi:hypothetical protein